MSHAVSAEGVTFPDRFVWGTAAAAHQVEGANWNNDWWAWEHDPRSPCVEVSGDACDHYHRYAADFRLLGEMGHNAHRFSIEWSRIEPEAGEFSVAALDHYARVLDSLEANGLTPFMTLHHFTSPRWFAAEGGWASPVAVDRFRRFTDAVAARLGPRVPFVCTINEPQIVAAFGYRFGAFPPGRKDPDVVPTVTRNFIAAHAASLDAWKQHAPVSQVGLALSLTDYQAVDEASVEVRDRVYQHMSGVYIDALRTGVVSGIGLEEEIRGLGGTSDFVGLQYYSRARVDASASPRLIAPPPDAETTQMGYEVYPEGFRATLTDIARAGHPVYVTENGIGTDDDRQRIRYLARHLTVLAEAIDAGIDVRGYLYWSAMDNFEWAYGYTKTFGLIACDRRTFERTPKPSAHYFAEVVRANAVDPAVTSRHLGQESHA